MVVTVGCVVVEVFVCVGVVRGVGEGFFKMVGDDFCFDVCGLGYRWEIIIYFRVVGC